MRGPLAGDDSRALETETWGDDAMGSTTGFLSIYYVYFVPTVKLFIFLRLRRR